MHNIEKYSTNGSQPAGSSGVACLAFKLRLSVLIVSSITYSIYAQGQTSVENLVKGLSGTIPTGFEDFFSQQSGLIVINLYGEQIRVPGSYALRSVTIDTSARSELELFFSDFGVSPRILTSLVDALINGVDSSPFCSGLISECALYPDTYDFVFNDDTKELKIFVNESEMSLAKATQYFQAENGKPSLVNSTQFYAQVSDGDTSLDWQNETNIALPLGYISTDTTLLANNEGESDFKVYEANYVIDRQGYSIQTGYDRTPNIENSAEVITLGQNSSGYHFTLFSNDRLASRSQTRYDSIPVFVAETTELEILRGDQIIYRTILNQGLNNISYSTFDKGSYNVTLRYMVGGRVVKEESRQIYNVPFFTMEKGEYDWFGQGGELENDDFGDFAYLKAGIAGRLTDRTVFGTGYTNVDGNSLASLYGEVVPFEGMRASVLGSSNFSDTTYVNAHIGYYSLFLNGERLRTEQDQFRSLYGNSDYSQITAGFSFHGFGSQNTLSYQHYITEANAKLFQEKSDISSLIFNTSRAFRYFNLSATVQHDQDNINRDRDSWMVGVSIDVPLDDFRVTSSYSRGSMTEDRMRNALQYKTQYKDNTDINAEVAITNHDSTKGSVASGQLSAYHTSDAFSARSNIYVESADRYNASLSISSTQLVNKNLMFTSDRARSFVVIDSDSVTGLADGEDIGVLEMRNRTTNQTKVMPVNKTRRIIPMDVYSQYQMDLTTRNSQYIEVEDAEYNHFSKPGTVMQVKSSMMRIKRYIVSFANKEGTLINNVVCTGLGCHEVESIGDGVYQVSVLDNFEFTLKSGDDICLLPNGNDNGQVLNVGRSVCMDEESIKELIQETPQGYRLYYMGTSRHKNNTTQSDKQRDIQIGRYVGHFLFAEDPADLKPVDGFLPRLVSAPSNALDKIVAQEL